MTSAQLQLPFDQAGMTPERRKDRSQEKSSNTNASAKPRRIRVREILHPSDDIAVLRMAQEFVNDVDLKEEVDVDTTLLSCIHIRNDIDRKGINLFLAFDNDEPIGFLVGVASPAFHRLGIVAEQKLCYVTRDLRGSSAAMRLVQAFEQWARLNGATQIFTGTVNKRYAEKTSQFFEQLGYARVGALHVKEI